MHATASQSMPIVTAYETLGEDGLRQSILATRARAVFTDVRLLKVLGKCLEKSKVEFIIYNDDRVMDKRDIITFKNLHPSLQVVSFKELRSLGEEHPTDPVLPDREDLSCIMYTSGSTGTPKGVCLKHRNIVAAGERTNHIIPESLHIVWTNFC
jgi:long-chain acyl-CoA synthetase